MESNSPGPFPYNCFDNRCPTRMVLDRIADKWTAMIMILLDERTMRFSEIQRCIRGISVKMLTQTVRALERDGLVARTVYPTVPLRVEYALTPLGRTLIEPLRHMKTWAESHMPAVQQARDAYDAREGVVA